MYWKRLAFQDHLVLDNSRVNGSVLVVIYFPLGHEYIGNAAEPWRKYLADLSKQKGFIYIDLFDDFRRLPPSERDKLFIAEGVVDFPGATGHYTEYGNEYMSGLIYRTLMANPVTAAKLAAP